MKLTFETKSSNSIEKWLQQKLTGSPSDKAFLEAQGAKGVAALSQATPKQTGTLAAGWGYSVTKTSSGWTLKWFNNAYPNKPVNIALLLQYGHATRTHGYVPGRDYINPAIDPILEATSAHFMKGD